MRITHTPAALERTTVTLPARVAAELRRRARTTQRPVSALVREAVERFLEDDQPSGLPSFAGVGASGQRDGSERAEEILRARARRGRR